MTLISFSFSSAFLSLDVSSSLCRQLAGDYFEAPRNWGDKYKQRIRGIFLAPTSGNYSFFIASDDSSQLYLNYAQSDGTVGTPALIASVAAATGFRLWTVQSSNISLIAGGLYYMEAIHIDLTGEDYVSVGVRLPSMEEFKPIPKSFFTGNPGTGTEHVTPSCTSLKIREKSIYL